MPANESTPAADADAATTPATGAPAAGSSTPADATPGTATTAPERPGWARPLAVLAAVTLSIVALIALQQISAFVAPVFLSLNLVLAVSPLMHWMIRRGVNRIVAGVLTLLVLYALLIAFVGLLVWSVMVLIQELPQYGAQFFALYRDLIGLLEQVGLNEATLTSQIGTVLSPAAITSMLQTVLGNVGVLLSFLGTLVVTVFFLFFDAISFEPRVKRLRRVRPDVGSAFDAFATGVGRYWIVTTVFGLVVAVLDVIALEILAVPFALVWGVFSFLTNYIPNIGFVIGMVPPVLMALLANGWVSALVVAVVWSVINFVLQSLVQPKFAGDAVGVTPTVSFLSVLVWTFALGPVGALLALPATLLVKAVLVDVDPRTRWVNLLIASDPVVRSRPGRHPADAGTRPIAAATASADRGGSASHGSTAAGSPAAAGSAPPVDASAHDAARGTVAPADDAAADGAPADGDGGRPAP